MLVLKYETGVSLQRAETGSWERKVGSEKVEL